MGDRGGDILQVRPGPRMAYQPTIPLNVGGAGAIHNATDWRGVLDLLISGEC